MPACFIALYSISKPPASLCFLIRLHTICSQFHLSPPSLCTRFFFSLFLLCFSLSLRVYTLHLPNHSIISFQSFFAVCLSLSFSISYFLPLHSVCAFHRQVLSLPPLLRLSLSIGSCPQPTAWLTNELSFQRHHITTPRALYLTSYSYSIAVTFADCY